MKEYDVVIIGAGTAGLTARRQVAKETDNYIIVDDGPLGTTCARVGCMPSKVLIQAANDFNRRHKLLEQGISGGENLNVDTAKVMQHVRSLRDRFVRGVMSSHEEWADKLVRKRATILSANTLDVGGEEVAFKKLIIGAGSSPVVPGPWKNFTSHLIDTNQFFEMESLPQSVAVVGLGVIGIELGQALFRLGIDVKGFTRGKAIGGLSDPELQEYTAGKLSDEMPIFFDGVDPVRITDENKIVLKIPTGEEFEFDKVLLSVGRSPNVKNLGLENLKVPLSDRGLPSINSNTMALTEAKHVFFPGDVNADRAILHEAADEGYIAGFNAVNEELCFKRRESIGVTFSDPNIASVGKRFSSLEKGSFVTGKVSFEGQGRSIVKLKEIGALHVYVDKETGLILGAEIFAPSGEHLAHLLVWSITMKLTVFEALKMPFYHPVIEEGLRTALRDAARQITPESNELFRCADSPIR